MGRGSDTVFAIIPAWNSAEDLSRCLESLLTLDYEKIRFVVADNNSSDDTKEVVTKYLRTFEVRGKILEYLSLEDNYGPTGAMNRAVKRLYRGEDYILRIDSDIVISDKEVLSKLVTFLIDNPETGLVGPCMTVSARGNEIVAAYWIRMLGTIRDVAVSKPVEVDLVNAGFVLIRAEVYVRLKELWSEILFYAWEELDISERARRVGYKTYYYPDARLIHNIKTMVSGSDRQIYYDFRNMLLVNWKFGSPSGRFMIFGVLLGPRLLFWFLFRTRFRVRPLYHAFKDFVALRKQYCAEYERG